MGSLKERMRSAEAPPSKPGLGNQELVLPPTPEERGVALTTQPTSRHAEKNGTQTPGRGTREDSKSAIAKAEMLDRVLELRKKGYSYKAIAKRTGLKEKVVTRYVHEALAKITQRQNDSAEHIRELELERTDKLLSTTWDIATKGVNKLAFTSIEEVQQDKIPVEVKFKAMDRVMKLMDHRAKLLGLYAPKKLEIGPMSASEYTDEQLLQVILEAKQRHDNNQAVDVEVSEVKIDEGKNGD